MKEAGSYDARSSRPGDEPSGRSQPRHAAAAKPTASDQIPVQSSIRPTGRPWEKDTRPAAGADPNRYFDGYLKKQLAELVQIPPRR